MISLPAYRRSIGGFRGSVRTDISIRAAGKQIVKYIENPYAIHKRYVWGRHVELRHLRYFLAVAEERHITRAAARLGLKQPPLSQQIRALEKELGTALFTRLPRGVALTPAGEGLLEDARALLGGVERAATRARAAAMGQPGRISIGLTTAASLHPAVTRTLRAYVENHAAVSLDLHANSAEGLTEALLREQVQVAIIRAAVARPADLVFEKLAQENMLIALPAKHHLVKRRASGAYAPISLRALAGERLILVRRHAGPGMYGNVLDVCHRAGFTPLVVAEVEQMLTAINLVAAGVGISMVPASIREIRQQGIVYCPVLDAPLLVAPLTLVYRRGEAEPAVTDFIELSRRFAKDARKRNSTRVL
jgi:DNA-binding transcriptional LysR family regulator